MMETGVVLIMPIDQQHTDGLVYKCLLICTEIGVRALHMLVLHLYPHRVVKDCGVAEALLHGHPSVKGGLWWRKVCDGWL